MASSSHYTTFPIMTTEPDKTEKMTTAEPPTTDMLTSHNNIDVTSEPPTIQTTFATILSTGEIGMTTTTATIAITMTPNIGSQGTTEILMAASSHYTTLPMMTTHPVLSTSSVAMATTTATTATIAMTMTPNIMSQGTTEILMASSSHYTTFPMMTTELDKTEKMTTAEPPTTDMLTSHVNIDVTSELATIETTFATILSTGMTTTTATIAITMTPNIVSQGTTEISTAASSEYTTFPMMTTEPDKTENMTTAEPPTTDMLTSHINIDVTSELPTIQTTFATILSTGEIVLSTSSIPMTSTTATTAITMTSNIVSEGTTEILMGASSDYTTFPMMTTEPDKTEKMTTAEPPTTDMLTSRINIDVTSELPTIQTTYATILTRDEIGIILFLALSV
ncbi:unnamed protein product [Rotaria sp. Silwood1]|nr:unnamed protein product [Rotaria sp. Silwood1]